MQTIEERDQKTVMCSCLEQGGVEDWYLRRGVLSLISDLHSMLNKKYHALQKVGITKEDEMLVEITP